LLLFGTLVVIFTPPRSSEKIRSDASFERGSETLDKREYDITIVGCDVSTPHSLNPETAAKGSFDIAILNEDIGRRGSSAEAFLKLVDDRFYDETYSFRVIQGFIVQWGHRSDDKKAKAAKERIPDADTPVAFDASGNDDNDPLAQKLNVLRKKQNVEGTITMIGGGTGQVFVNTGDNRRLDKDGTIPFGIVLEGTDGSITDRNHSGMRLITSIYHDYKAGQGQIPAVNNRQVATKFPEMGRIDRCYRLE
jgi:cyclophilin family peptidyl-prolyl cis-trans isomerase